jgi:hypothetical protein
MVFKYRTNRMCTVENQAARQACDLEICTILQEPANRSYLWKGVQ